MDPQTILKLILQMYHLNYHLYYYEPKSVLYV